MTGDAAPDNPRVSELMTTAQTAAYIGRPDGTLRQWRHKGIGPRGFRVEGLVMYRKSEVDRWLGEFEDLADEPRSRPAPRLPPLRVEDLGECPVCLAVLRVGHLRQHTDWHGTRP